ncbi:MAG: PQQ-binding-like beta-propeller repeat protein, partial [Candidatus Eremiobacteraeota bacterium]|nr:PQQ-binding-like beta-propeller repeat protein [Candidatus Eremiobacteraeota bacterium]
MEPVERYIKEVRRYLPSTERDDIVAELSSNLAAEIDDRSSELGRGLDDDEIEKIVRAHGNPMAFASRYGTSNRTFSFGRQLVGPALFPFYIRVLAANLLVACIVAIVAALYAIPTWIGVPNIVAHVVLQFAIVTLVFVALQRYLDRDRDRDRSVTAVARVSRFASASALIWFVGSNVWLVDLLRTQNLFQAEPGSTLVLAPVWRQVVGPYIAVVALEVVRNAVNFVRPELLRFRAAMITGVSAVSFIAIAMLLHAGVFVDAANPHDPEQSALAGAIDRGIYVGLIVAAIWIAATIVWQIRKYITLRSAAVPLAVACSVMALACVASGASAGESGHCAGGVVPFAPRADSPAWNGWGGDIAQSRFQPAAMAGLDATSVTKLSVKWAFGFPGVTRAYGQPTIFGGWVFVGSENHHVYALNARTGCINWDIDSGAPVRTAITLGKIGDRWAAYFGDQMATAHAVDAATGESIWQAHVDDHPSALITGAPTLAFGKLYVPVSSQEEAAAADPKYACCTFRGSVVALDATTGKTVWKTYTIANVPTHVGTNASGVERSSPSGAAVWSSPTVDVARNAVYVTTGNGYSGVAAATTDALIAFDATSGKVQWSHQMTANDAENLACGLPSPYDANCPQANGPDDDFGSSPILQKLDDGGRVLIAGQKSGMVYAVDPDRAGAPLWPTRVGAGSKLGGVQWGSAADAGVAYVAVSDVKF